MIELMERLIDSGHAYAAGGDVYFAVRSFPAYGALSGQKIDDVVQGEPDSDAKRDQRDFALWKAAKPGEPSWATPWGRGRPGWHLECSAMATMYLGPEFDVHGGGIDLIFPHHENEQAQSHAAGDPFARFWLHNAWVTMAGEKMSKSLGNTLSIDALLRRVRGVELRYYLVAAALPVVDRVLRRARFRRRSRRTGGSSRSCTGCANASAHRSRACCARSSWRRWTTTSAPPGALAAVHNTVREGNTALDAGNHKAALGAASSVRAMTAVLGLDPLDPQWARSDDNDTASTALSTLVDDLLAGRQAARERRDFAAADEVRGRLAAAGIVVEDSPDGRRGRSRTRDARQGEREDGRQLQTPRRGAQGRHEEGDGRRLRRPASAWAGGQRPHATRRAPPWAPQGRGAARSAKRAATPSKAKTAATAAARRRRDHRDRARPQPGRRVPAGGGPRAGAHVTVGSTSDERIAEAVHLAAEAGVPILEVPRGDSTGSPAARCTRASRSPCRPTSTPTPTSCWRSPRRRRRRA